MIDARPMLVMIELALQLNPSVDSDSVVRRASLKIIEHNIMPDVNKTLKVLSEHSRPFSALSAAIKVVEHG